MARANKRKIGVIGGAGYIGSHTVVELVKAGYEPVIVDNFSNSRRFILKRLERLLGRPVAAYAADCTRKASLDKIFRIEGPFHGIIHFAALKCVAESIVQPARYYRNNVDGMLALLEAAVQYKIPHFVFSSSCTVYGQPDKLPVLETAYLKDAESPYGDSKKISEGMLRAFVKSGAPVNGVAVRYFNPIGAHPSGLIGELPLGIPNNLVPLVAQVAAGIRPSLTVFGDDHQTPDGTCIRDYIHVIDLARAHIRALEFLQGHKPGSCFDIFNIGTGRGQSVLQILRTFEKVTGIKVKYTVGPRRVGDIDKIYANVDKARKLLGWKAELSLEDALYYAWTWEKNLNKEAPCSRSKIS